MMLWGAPDFQHAETLPDGPVWPAFETTRWLAPPTAVRLATTPEGMPAFHLSVSRPVAPFMPPPPYAVLDLALATMRDDAATLEALRERHARATLAPLHPSAGRVRLEPPPGSQLPGDDLARPVDLIWNGLGRARLYMRFGAESAGPVARLVEEGTLAMTVTMAVGFDGVSPRLPMEISFDPAELLAALEAAISASDLTLRKLAAAIRETGDSLPVERRGDTAPAPRQGFADALADRIAARFGTFEHGAAATEPTLRLEPADAVGSGNFTWDLARPVRARRWLEFQPDPFAALRAHVERHGPARLLTRSTATPIPTGAHVVTVFANLPETRVGLEALGVTIRAAPSPPVRPHAAVATAMIEAPEDSARMTLKLSPGEPLAFTARGFAVIADGQGVRRLEGAERQVDGPLLRLTPEDFAILPLALEAAPELLAEARLEGDIRYRHADRDHALAFTLDSAQPALALALPAEAADRVLTVTAHSTRGDGTLALGPMPAQHTRFEMSSFPQFGPQTAVIRCTPPPDTGVVALELVADGRPDSDLETLAFTADQSRRHWRYFAASPFRGGFRWRPRAEAGSPQHGWRHHASAADPLEVDAATLARAPR